MTDLYQQFCLVEKKELIAQEGLEMLKELQQDLSRNIAWANIVGTTAVIANLIIVPLNCIINAFGMKKAKGLYQKVVVILYDSFGKSGSRLDINQTLEQLISCIKTWLLAELTGRGLVDYIPGVNIIVGLAEDSATAFQTVTMVDSGSAELRRIESRLNRSIDKANAELAKLGIKKAELLDRADIVSRTV